MATPAMIGLFIPLRAIAREQHSSLALLANLPQMQRSAKINVALKQQALEIGRGTVKFE
jgi:hypothetical protein